jgi:hypothetical protein
MKNAQHVDPAALCGKGQCASVTHEVGWIHLKKR